MNSKKFMSILVKNSSSKMVNINNIALVEATVNNAVRLTLNVKDEEGRTIVFELDQDYPSFTQNLREMDENLYQ